MSAAAPAAGVLLDLDGTLTDPFEGITASIAHALERLDAPSPPPESLGWCIGPPLAESFRVLLDTDDEARVAHAIGAYRERFADVGLFENRLFPEIPGVLEALARRGCALFVATSKPRVYARRIVEHFGLDGHFRAVHGAELDGTRAAKAALIEHVLEVESLVPEASAMVGDRSHDVLGARANGVPAIGVLWGYGTRGELSGAGADAICEHPHDLDGCVGRVLAGA